MDLDILFVIGLPRSGTSLVHKLIQEASGRKAPRFRDFGIDTSRVPDRVRELNKTFKDEDSLAEDNDWEWFRRNQVPYEDQLCDYYGWLERRGDRWVLKSPDHIAHLPELMDVFPEARFLWCMRPAGETLASIREYWEVAGVGPEYSLQKAVKDARYITCTHPEKFDCIWTPSIPEFESDREPLLSIEQGYIDHIQSEVRGLVRNVSSSDFTKYYS